MPRWLEVHIQQLRLSLRLMRIRQDIMLLTLLHLEEEDARRRRNRRTCWVKPWIQSRPMLGQYERLMHELVNEAHGDFNRYLRMPPDMFI